jgi:hypothetical protein
MLINADEQFGGVINVFVISKVKQEYGYILKEGCPINWCAGQGFNSFCKLRKTLFAAAPIRTLYSPKIPKGYIRSIYSTYYM